MSKDVILDKYARLYEIPNQLALLGHELECFCLSYQSHECGIWNESNELKKLIWHSCGYKGISKIGLLTYPFDLLRQLRHFQPDIIIAASDMPHIIMGQWFAKKLNRPFIADLYDNFEAYGQARIPLIKHLFRNALSSAKLIITTSVSLSYKIQKEYPKIPNIIPIPSVINKSLFKTGDQLLARKMLNLPEEKVLIGTAGGLTQMKGIEDLFNAWTIIREKIPNAYLVLAGPTEKNTFLPNDDRVIYLGLLPHDKIVSLFQALDVGILCIPNDEFGRYCFPQKAYEMLATHLSIVSTSIGDMEILVGDHKGMLYTSGKYEELAQSVLLQISEKVKLDIHIPDWTESINKINFYLTK